MKKTSSKKSVRKQAPKKRSFFDSTRVQWFGIDIHHIALGVSFVGCIVAILLVQKQKIIEEQQQVLAAQTGTTVPYVQVGGIPICENGNCTNVSPVPRLTCIPRPACLDATPRCMIAEPAEGWCPSLSGSPEPTSITPPVTPPPGCSYKKICLMIMCNRNNPNCHPCHDILVCPSGVPHPSTMPPITCTPSPTCQMGKFCPQIMRKCWPDVSITPRVFPSCKPQPTCNHPILTGSVPIGRKTSDNTFTSNPVTSIFSSFLHTFFSMF